MSEETPPLDQSLKADKDNLEAQRPPIFTTNRVLLLGGAILFGTPLAYNSYSDYQDSVVTPYVLSVADRAPIATAVVKTNDYLYRDISRTPFTNPFAQGQRTGILLREGQTVEILERVNLGNSPFHAYIIRVTVSRRAPIIGYFDKEMLRNEQSISPATPQNSRGLRQTYQLSPFRPEHRLLGVQPLAVTAVHIAMQPKIG